MEEGGGWLSTEGTLNNHERIMRILRDEKEEVDMKKKQNFKL